MQRGDRREDIAVALVRLGQLSGSSPSGGIHTLTEYAIRVFMAEAAEDLEEGPRAHFNIRSKRVIRRYVEDQAAFPHPTLNTESPNHLQKCRSEMH